MSERDIILVGGGESSKIIISSVMGSLKHRVKGVLFIDHDKDTIREMYDEMSRYSGEGVEVRDVRLHKRVLDREKFDIIADEMGVLGGGVTWEDPLPNHPPMVRVQTRLWGREILDALWDMLPTVGADDTHTGRLVEPRVMIVFLFGMTGMTSSTVGVEAAVVLRDRLRSRLLNDRESGGSPSEINSTLDTGTMPLFMGVGCFPPDPTDGAGQYNIPHGLRMSGVIKGLLAPSSSPRELDMGDKPFNKFFLIDGSGAWRTQDNKEDYSQWVARTLSTLLTCQPVDAGEGDDTFYDSIELMDSCESFSHVGLIMAGLSREDQALLQNLRFVKENAPDVYDASLDDPDVDILREVIGKLVGTTAESVVQDVRDAANEWQDAKMRLGWWNRWLPRRRRALHDARRGLKQATATLPEEVDSYIDDLNNEWEKWSHQRLWAMPLPASHWLTDPLEDSLPLRASGSGPADHNIIQDRNESRQSAHDMVRMLMRHLIDPITTSPIEVSNGTMMLVASTNVKRDYPLPESEDMRVSFGGEWITLMSEHNELGNSPMHVLLWWQPKDGKIMPMYYRANGELRERDLPAVYDGWPSNPK